ncbi:hypothetical protein CLU79DRAFT_781418 [Phycomyces nitens]|nr:hypothetical protein CLU79DRAFT_781418 [Phycomyces nitens]
MLVIGQQREFDMPAVSSGTTVSESIAGSIPESDSNRQSPSGSYREGSGMSLQGNTAQGSEEDPINGYPYTSGGLYPRSNSPNCPGPSVPHYCHERSSLSLYRQPLGYNSYRVNVVYNYRESRPIADYDGILVNDIEYASDSYEPHWDFADHSPPGTPIPSQYEDSSFDPDNDRLPRIATDKPERDDRHYTSTFMCMTLTVNEQTIF